MDFCIYDSRLTDFKEPFGAVPAGTAVRFCMHLPKALCPRLVEFVLCSDGEADRWSWTDEPCATTATASPLPRRAPSSTFTTFR